MLSAHKMPKRGDKEKNRPRHNEKTLKLSRKRGHVIYKGTRVILTLDLSTAQWLKKDKEVIYTNN